MSDELKPGWHPQDIIAEVRKRGTTLAGIAATSGMSKNTLYWALRKRHERANLAIAAFLGVPAHELWPRWFPSISSSTPEPIASRSKESRIPTKAA